MALVEQRPVRRRRRPCVSAGILVAVLTLGGCSAEDGGDASSSPDFDDPGVAHVHGLGVDPGDGTLYAATHTGIFALPAKGEATRVADRYQDTMGFTVVGPNHFLGSGHPDQQDEELHEAGTPPLLGLIESTDGGQSWEKRSLFGEADFHALAAAHGLVYGYESTGSRFLVSTDKTTWETRNDGVAISSFAVDPTDADHIIATTSTGVATSSDGGRTFAAMSGAPPLTLVTWDPSRGLWGVAAGGAVLSATTPEGPWEDRGTLPGEPEAFLVDGSALYAAVMSPEGRTAIYRSNDDAATWQLRYRDPR